MAEHGDKSIDTETIDLASNEIADRAELEANWTRMKAGRPLDKIPPLD